MPGFWRRPVARMYSYNLDVGEHYYSPMTSYLDDNSDRQVRGETPGALTFSERLAKKWITGRRYDSVDRSYRSSSMTREAANASASSTASASAAESARLNRAASEMRTASTFGAQAAAASTSAFSNRSQLRQQALSASQTDVRAASTSIQAQRQESTQEVERTSSSSATAKMVARMQQEQRQKLLSVNQQQSSTRQSRMSRQEETTVQKASNIQVDDAISKKIADIRMQPYVDTQEIREAEAATLRARARIMDLERELEDITKRAIMTSTKAVKSAKQMAYEASMAAEEESKAASTKKSRKVIVESSAKIRG